jgi:hypothetical protein
MPRTRWIAFLAALTLAVLLAHGYHPLSEDGGLYVAGVKWLLNPALFPHDTDFVREHLRFSLFAPAIGQTVRLTHLSLLTVLLATYLATTALTLFAAQRILAACRLPLRSQLAGTALLAAWWTIPVAGTSLLLMDPYVTGRSFSTPLTLLALAFALEHRDPGPARRHLATALCLLAAAAFHPLMAAYGLALILTFYLRPKHWPILLLLASLIATALQLTAAPDSPAVTLAAYSRYYWFLSQWQWYELLGLLGPPIVLLALLRLFPAHDPLLARLTHAAIALGSIATFICLVFAHQSYAAHPVARLQPLRVYLEIYALLAILLGAALALRYPRLTASLIAASFLGFAVLAHLNAPTSPQVELPAYADHNPNPWAQAFLWIKHNTPNDALIALDDKYVNTEGEDAQTFRAIAERSTLPDFSKDGGEAAITPSLANRWLAASNAQANLSEQDDPTRDALLAPFHPTYMLLHADAKTAYPCPYQNRAVKVCRLGQPRATN